MAVIVDLALPSQEFELGRILDMEADTSIILETMVPIGAHSVPFFRVYDARSAFEKNGKDHPAVEEIHVVSSNDGETLYALDRDVSTDTFFDGLRQYEASLMEARGTGATWNLELRFPAHDALSGFQEYCNDAGLPIVVEGLYNPTRPDAGPWYGLTPRQREALTVAVERGYYSIPRETSTMDLAAEFEISDQAITERLRRAIDALVSNTLLLTPAKSDQD